MRHRVFLGVGSNIDPDHHIACALDELDRRIELKRISSVYRSEPIGFDGDAFLNLAVEATTSLGPGELHHMIRSIEYGYGRVDALGKFSSRQVDVDILAVDELHGTVDGIDLPRDETTRNAFVLAPMAEIAGDLVLPGERESLAELWARYDRNQHVERVEFSWRGRCLPRLDGPLATAPDLDL